MTELLTVSDVVTAYGKIEALKGVSLTVREGGITCLLGPNGAGKTTLMLTITGILKPKRGEIRFLGQPITAASPSSIVQNGPDKIRVRSITRTPVSGWFMARSLNLPRTQAPQMCRTLQS